MRDTCCRCCILVDRLIHTVQCVSEHNTCISHGGVSVLLLCLQVFDTKGKQGESVWIAGTNVRSGKLTRSHLFRVLRNGEVVKEGLTASSMRRFKDRVNEVSKGKASPRFFFILHVLRCDTVRLSGSVLSVHEWRLSTAA